MSTQDTSKPRSVPVQQPSARPGGLQQDEVEGQPLPDPAGVDRVIKQSQAPEPGSTIIEATPGMKDPTPADRYGGPGPNKVPARDQAPRTQN